MRSDVRYPPIEALRAFECAARLGSFERAAEELSVTPSAVSKRITTLEQLLGARLFTRSAKALIVTAAGKEYLQEVSDVLARLANIGLHHRAPQSLQRLQIVAPPTFCRQVLVPTLGAFAAQHPDVEPEIVLSTPFLDLSQPECDVRITFGPQGADCEPLLFEHIQPMASPSLVSRLRLRQPQDLAAATLLRCPIEPWRPWFAAAQLAWPEPAQGPRFVDLGLTLEAAAGGQGVALARRSLAHQWLAEKKLQVLFDVRAFPATGYCLRIEKPSAASIVFSQWLRTHCAELEKLSGA